MTETPVSYSLTFALRLQDKFIILKTYAQGYKELTQSDNKFTLIFAHDSHKKSTWTAFICQEWPSLCQCEHLGHKGLMYKPCQYYVKSDYSHTQCCCDFHTHTHIPVHTDMCVCSGSPVVSNEGFLADTTRPAFIVPKDVTLVHINV